MFDDSMGRVIPAPRVRPAEWNYQQRWKAGKEGDMSLDKVRDILKRRDGLDDAGVDELFEILKEEIEEGANAEDALAGVFGLEPDYFWDDEVQAVILEVFRG